MSVPKANNFFVNGLIVIPFSSNLISSNLCHSRIKPTLFKTYVDAVEILDWDSEGKVKGGKIFYDRLTALEQIGLVPPLNNTILPYLH
jgi:hypothetical protein